MTARHAFLSHARVSATRTMHLVFRSFRTVALIGVIAFALNVPAPVLRAQSSRENEDELATIDSKTRWGFRTISPANVSSPIVRLGDVVKPLDPNMAGWQRLRHSPIGLVPIGGQSMTIQRARLGAAIHNAEATPRNIDWIGPEEIDVIYKPGGAPSVAQATYTEPSPGRSTTTKASVPAKPPLSPLESKRIIHWIQLAIDRELPEVAEAYRIEINRLQPGLAELKSISGVTSIEAIGAIDDGVCHFHVQCRSVNGPMESDIEATLEAHPTVVVPRKALARGHMIEPGDLTTKPIPDEDFSGEFIVDADSAIGLEVRSSVRAGRPIRHDELGSPILIHRGDLIEVRVVAGGITVTTNAKSLGNGAVADLIEIETLQPRRRLVARVAQSGIAEIVTRAPQVKR